MTRDAAGTSGGRWWKPAAVVVLPLAALAVFASLSYGWLRDIAALELTGYTGRQGEWELTAKLAKAADGDELVGPLTARHVGLCTQDGPQEKTGEMRVRLSRFSPAVTAAVVLDGLECSYRGRLSDSGELVCPDRRPMPITMWTR
ncbi:MAG TPA: hypothetical protein VEC60_12145 [Reyranella sp.]|nr:hypothetical protein [Reyranella sp.]